MEMKSYGLGSWSGVVRIVGKQHEGMKGKGQGKIVRMPEVIMKCPYNLSKGQRRRAWAAQDADV